MSTIGLLSSTHNDGAFAPATIPVTADEADPIALPPDSRSDRDLGVDLYTHLKITLQTGSGNRVGVRGSGGAALEAIVHHRIKVPFLRCLNRRMLGLVAIDGFVENGIVRIVLLHGVKISRTLEKVRALTAGVFSPDRLAIDALR